ncbi:hypothetical protein BXU06_07460 [Aquaspirillum sp. LM1]|uniref:hypothetical protein n=1 Tax=Aquaspirillum sp. LM1 TaxID=1938604 RepID=UPI000983AF05|nr:hypothetical protein [Aquaspirillum sp. LM1]AQR64920.1 hypothetical protein BXU06_07460 [Aquaspirillum sp. LM1]
MHRRPIGLYFTGLPRGSVMAVAMRGVLVGKIMGARLMALVHEQARMAFILQSNSLPVGKLAPAINLAANSSRDAQITSEKLCLSKAKSIKINTLDSRLRGNDDFFSVSLVASHHDLNRLTGDSTVFGMSFI